MATKTHPNFKSIIASVSSANDMSDKMYGALCYQYMFDRRISPWDMEQFGDEDIQKFELDLEKVDRLYHIYHFDDGVSGANWEILVRMDHNGRKAYVNLTAGCDFTGFECQGGGYIYITFNVNVFTRIMLEDNIDRDAIYHALRDDGVVVEMQSECDLRPNKWLSNAPMLKYLCHQAIVDNKDRLQHYPQVLPKILVESIEEFIMLRDTKEIFDEF